MASGQLCTSYAHHASFVSQLTQEVMKDLAPQAGERILDVGCGDGELLEVMRELGCNAVGIDASENMIEAAKQRGLDALVIDAQKMDFNEEFDAVFSNAAMHWMPNQTALLNGVYRAAETRGTLCRRNGWQR